MAGPLESEDAFKKLRGLTEFARALGYIDSLDAIIRLGVERTRDVLGCERVALLLTDAREVLSVRAVLGIASLEKDLPGQLIDEAFVGRVRVRIEEGGRTRFIAVPLVMGGRVGGVLAVGLPLDGQVEGDEWLVAALADQIAVSIERTRSNEAVAVSERKIRRWRHIFENAGWAVAVVEHETHRIDAANAAFAAMHGYSVPELLGCPYETVFADGSRAIVESYARNADRQDNYVYRSEHARKDGSRFPVLAHVSVYRDESGRIRYRAGTYQDVTAIERAEQVLRDAVQARDAFLSIASHELKTPLTPLRLHLESLGRIVRRDTAPASPPKVLARLAGAERQVARLERLVLDLLDVSELIESRLELFPEETDLGALVSAVAAEARGEFERTATPLEETCPAGVTGFWDRTRVAQVVSKVLLNALKYGQGKPVSVAVESNALEATIRVRDRGIGISPGDQGRIFERFERAASPEHYGGFGIGLWIARELVEAMGGTIRVESAPGQGSTFTIKLPRRRASRAA
jgi:PAS domain S-box-containing protein